MSLHDIEKLLDMTEEEKEEHQAAAQDLHEQAEGMLDEIEEERMREGGFRVGAMRNANRGGGGIPNITRRTVQYG